MTDSNQHWVALDDCPNPVLIQCVINLFAPGFDVSSEFREEYVYISAVEYRHSY